MQRKSKEEERHNCSVKVERTRTRGELRQKPFLVEVQARTSETGHFTKNDVNPLQSNPYQTTSCNGNDCGDKQQV